MDLIGVKVLACFIFFFLAIFFGWTPFWCLRRCQRRTERVGKDQPFFVQCLHYLASGVLISTCFLHLLPESLEAVDKAISSANKVNGRYNGSTIILSNVTFNDSALAVPVSSESRQDVENYPVGELMVALGLLFIYVMETVLKSCTKTGTVTSIVQNEDDHRVDRKTPNMSRRNGVANDKVNTQVNGKRQNTSVFSFRWLRLKFSHSGTPYQPIHQKDRALLVDRDSTDCSLFNRQADTKDCQSVSPLSDDVLPESRDQTANISAKSSQFRCLALIAASCIHGFFDGVMLGLQTSMSTVLSLLFALSIHKSFVAVGLSLNLASITINKVSNAFILLYMFAFALVAPLGVLASSALFNNVFSASGEGSIGQGCLQAFSVGTFMYVSFMELTVHWHKSLSTVVVNHVFLIVGFSLMAGLRAVLGES